MPFKGVKFLAIKKNLSEVEIVSPEKAIKDFSKYVGVAATKPKSQEEADEIERVMSEIRVNKNK